MTCRYVGEGGNSLDDARGDFPNRLLHLDELAAGSKRPQLMNEDLELFCLHSSSLF